MTSIDRLRLLELIDQGAQVIDVLPDADCSAQHIPGAWKACDGCPGGWTTTV